eukprot:3350254-Pyramimonas_sp.AAC.1
MDGCRQATQPFLKVAPVSALSAPLSVSSWRQTIDALVSASRDCFRDLSEVQLHVSRRSELHLPYFFAAGGSEGAPGWKMAERTGRTEL